MLSHSVPVKYWKFSFTVNLTAIILQNFFYPSCCSFASYFASSEFITEGTIKIYTLDYWHSLLYKLFSSRCVKMAEFEDFVYFALYFYWPAYSWQKKLSSFKFHVSYLSYLKLQFINNPYMR